MMGKLEGTGCGSDILPSHTECDGWRGPGDDIGFPFPDVVCVVCAHFPISAVTWENRSHSNLKFLG